jgi:hypothetical protein
MNVAIIHYHLNRGGVTTVIRSHIHAIATAQADVARVLLLYGGSRTGWPDDDSYIGPQVTLHVVPELAYDKGPPAAANATYLADALERALGQHDFQRDATLLHVHNHHLGKNASLPGACQELALRGYPLLLQIHDFPEDFRPENYQRLLRAYGDPQRLERALYPQAAHVHYAVLNGRDFGLLKSCGFTPERLNLVPNPVEPPAAFAEREKSRAKAERCFGLDRRRFVVYPVRAIRRKNLGEMLLWAAAFGDRAVFAVTQPAITAAERPSYCTWKDMAQRLRLSCRFEIGNSSSLTYAEILAAADQVLTTSVAEGFGMVFLEPWLLGKVLLGRDLPEITADFVQAKLDLRSLHEAVWVPLEWCGPDQFLETFERLYGMALERFGRRPPAPAVIRGNVERLLHDGHVDFARLPSRLQQQTIKKVGAGGAIKDLITRNPWMHEAISGETDFALVMRNGDLFIEY